MAYPYSNYFCQKLFFLLPMDIRKNIIENMCKNVLDLCENIHGQCSVIFIFENDITDDEKKLAIDLLKDKMKDLIWKPKFSRVAECIIGCFDFKLTGFLVSYCLDNFMKFVKFREGYFLLRTIVKAIKVPQVQNHIAQIVDANYERLIKYSNGSLLIQCMIHNFPVVDFVYFKSCSKHINKNLSKEDTVSNVTKNFKNKALELIIKVIISNVETWDAKYSVPLIDCLIRVGGEPFEKCFMKMYSKGQKSKDLIIDKIICLENGKEYMERIFKNFNLINVSKIKDQIKDRIKLFDVEIQKHWDIVKKPKTGEMKKIKKSNENFHFMQEKLEESSENENYESSIDDGEYGVKNPTWNKKDKNSKFNISQSLNSNKPQKSYKSNQSMHSMSSMNSQQCKFI